MYNIKLKDNVPEKMEKPEIVKIYMKLDKQFN
jgi:hypothetical protein